MIILSDSPIIINYIIECQTKHSLIELLQSLVCRDEINPTWEELRQPIGINFRIFKDQYLFILFMCLSNILHGLIRNGDVILVSIKCGYQLRNSASELAKSLSVLLSIIINMMPAPMCTFLLQLYIT